MRGVVTATVWSSRIANNWIWLIASTASSGCSALASQYERYAYLVAGQAALLRHHHLLRERSTIGSSSSMASGWAHGAEAAVVDLDFLLLRGHGPS